MRDKCLLDKEEHISLGIGVSRVGEHISLGICAFRWGNTYH